MSVKDIMSRHLVTVSLDEDIKAMHRSMASNNIRHLLVVENRKVQGIVSDRDILKSISPYAATDSETQRDLVTLQRKAHQIMTRFPVSISPDTTIRDAASTLLKYNLTCLPVIDKNNHLKGILSFKDILKFGIKV